MRRTRQYPPPRKQPDVDEYADISRIENFKLPCDDQDVSPLFNVLPGEIRDLIYAYTLSDFEDLTHPYDLETCYRRPGYMAARKTETSLVRTCQKIYSEAWFLVWTQAQHTFFLTADGRKPTKTTDHEQMARTSQLIERLHPDTPTRRKEVHSIQIFAQLYMLEPGAHLNSLLQIPHFLPRTITITLRHTDIWYWEQDHPIHVNTPWVHLARFPTSVTKLRIQFESTERRKPQVDYVINRAREEWFFQRIDDVHLVPDTDHSPEHLRWSGSSTWEGRRWIRDEDDQEPGILHYYLATLSFKPANIMDDAVGYDERKKRTPHKIQVPPDIAAKTHIPGGSGRNARLPARNLEQAGVTAKTPASEALRLHQEWNETWLAQRRKLGTERRAAWLQSMGLLQPHRGQQ